MNIEDASEALKNAMIAEVASDVLQVKSDVAELRVIISQLKDSLPQLFDLLKSGMIETLESINKGLLEAGGDRIDFVKGQLHVYIEQAVGKALENNSDKIESLQALFLKQNTIATQNLKEQYQEVSNGMKNILSSTNISHIPFWIKITFPSVLITIALCTGAVCWQLASYKEAVKMQIVMNQVSAHVNEVTTQKPKNPK